MTVISQHERTGLKASTDAVLQTKAGALARDASIIQWSLHAAKTGVAYDMAPLICRSDDEAMVIAACMVPMLRGFFSFSSPSYSTNRQLDDAGGFQGAMQFNQTGAVQGGGTSMNLDEQWPSVDGVAMSSAYTLILGYDPDADILRFAYFNMGAGPLTNGIRTARMRWLIKNGANFSGFDNEDHLPAANLIGQSSWAGRPLSSPSWSVLIPTPIAIPLRT